MRVGWISARWAPNTVYPAMPLTSNTARKLLLERPSFWSGLEGRLLTEPPADLLNLPPGKLGYLVQRVARGSPGEAVGLRGGTRVAVIDGESLVVGGDILLEVQGIPVGGLASYERIRAALAGAAPGDALRAIVLRAGRILEFQGRMP